MRKRIWVACAVVLVVFVLLLLKATQNPKDALPEPSEARAHQLQAQREELAHETVAALPPRVNAPTRAPRDSNAVAAEMVSSWQAPIEFYGKVVDENSNAVAGAEVSFHWVELPKPDGNKGSRTVSDVDGLFSLQDARGPSLSVSVSKPGYYTSRQGSPVFRYGLFNDGHFSPDPQNPIIFHLRRKGLPEPLISLKRNYPIPRDGAAVSIDLVAGGKTRGESGTFVVQCWTEDQGKSPGQKYDWHCRVGIPGGGILITSEEFAFLAPEIGYKPSAEIVMPAEHAGWTSDVDLRFFYRLADGRYGRMTFSMVAGGQHFCMIDSILNPTGSRNLEPSN